MITGHLFQSLGYINPTWWLPDLLTAAMGADRFRRQIFRRLAIGLWQNQPSYPRRLLPWDEGSTQVGVVITWETPPTTIFVGAQYGSDLSARVSAGDGRSGYPSDQLVLNIRVGLHRAGYFDWGKALFPQFPRDFATLVLSPAKGHPLVDLYRDPRRLRAAIPHSDRLVGLPRAPFVGQLDYADIDAILRRQSRWMNGAERRVAGALVDYLEYKRATLPTRSIPAAIASAGAATTTTPRGPVGAMTGGGSRAPKILSVG